MLTIDESIAFLKRAKARIGGDKTLVLSLSDSHLEDVMVTNLVIRRGYVEVQAVHPALLTADRFDVIKRS
jgi:hypothetical protein